MQTTSKLLKKKVNREPISMLTCYDYWSAKILDNTAVDMLLVGDSVAMVVHGFKDTLPADIQMMKLHTAAVRRGAPNKFIVADVPFLVLQESTTDFVNSVKELMVAGANAIKVEGARKHLDKLELLIDAGVPVMGHLGLTPQKHNQLGGFCVQAKSSSEQDRLLQDAFALAEAGCFSLVLECVPEAIAQKVSEQISCPVIGIGAGAGTDGQVLVLQDLLGANSQFRPKFVRVYENLEGLVRSAVEEFCEDVQQKKFPGASEVYL